MSEKEVPVKLGRPKSEEKRKTILGGASNLFLSNGFTNTSMDMVAKEAGVSKQTVYSHFNNKDELYTAVIDAKCQEYRLDASRLEHCNAPLHTVLTEIANQVISLLQDPDVIAMYTVVIGEAKNNPHVAELFYNAGPLQSVETVARIIRDSKPGQLSDLQAKAIATDFFNLIKGDFHMRSMLHLPFTLNDQQRQCLCDRVCTQITLLLDNFGKFPYLTYAKH
jgi:TetR/AcrR family transcriptional repressor of mexJK operon